MRAHVRTDYEQRLSRVQETQLSLTDRARQLRTQSNDSNISTSCGACLDVAFKHRHNRKFHMEGFHGKSFDGSGNIWLWEPLPQS